MSKTLKMIVHELPRTLGEINHKLLLADLKLALKEVEKLEQQLQQAHRAAEESAKDAYRRGWEQAKRKCVKISMGMFDCNGEEVANVIDALEYKEPTNE